LERELGDVENDVEDSGIVSFGDGGSIP